MKFVSTFNIQLGTYFKKFKIVDVNLAQPPFHYVHAPLQIMKRIPIPQSALRTSKRDARTGGVFHGSNANGGT